MFKRIRIESGMVRERSQILKRETIESNEDNDRYERVQKYICVHVSKTFLAKELQLLNFLKYETYFNCMNIYKIFFHFHSPD